MSDVVRRPLRRRIVMSGMTRPTFEPEPAVDLAHPLGVTPGQVVVHRDEVHALAREAVQVHGQGRDERLALTGLHLGDPAEVQRRTAHELDVVVALADACASPPHEPPRRPR